MERQPRPEMAHDLITFELQEAEGTIQPTPEQAEVVRELTERLLGDEFYSETTDTIPSVCIDGRGGGEALEPNAAGGSETLYVADDLTTKRLTRADGTTLGGYREILDVITAHNHRVGGHTDAHANEEKSGCGANDKLPQIYEFIAEHGDVLLARAAELGVEVNDDDHALIIGQAASRQEFSKSTQLLEALESNAPANVDHLTGDHHEVVAIINTKPGTTLDRTKLAEVYHDDVEAFNVDAWAFDEAAYILSLTPEEAAAKKAAMVYYNLATAYVLCGPRTKIVVR